MKSTRRGRKKERKGNWAQAPPGRGRGRRSGDACSGEPWCGVRQPEGTAGVALRRGHGAGG